MMLALSPLSSALSDINEEKMYRNPFFVGPDSEEHNFLPDSIGQCYYNQLTKPPSPHVVDLCCKQQGAQQMDDGEQHPEQQSTINLKQRHNNVVMPEKVKQSEKKKSTEKTKQCQQNTTP